MTGWKSRMKRSIDIPATCGLSILRNFTFLPHSYASYQVQHQQTFLASLNSWSGRYVYLAKYSNGFTLLPYPQASYQMQHEQTFTVSFKFIVG